MDDPIGVDTGGNLEETVEQLRARLAMMKRLVGAEQRQRQGKTLAQTQAQGDSIIDGKFLSVVFAVVLLLIICVSSYAFLNLYYAILKKFPHKEHTEL